MNRLIALPLGLVLLTSLAQLACGAEDSDVESSGMVIVESAFDVPTTADRLEAGAEARGLTIFARIDHAVGATEAGMALLPTELIIFGTAKVGTPLMQCDRTVGIDLPLKALIWREESGQVLLGYNSTTWLTARHDLGECAPSLAKIDTVLAALSAEATGASEEAHPK